MKVFLSSLFILFSLITLGGCNNGNKDMKLYQPEEVEIDVRARLGEGAIWDYRTQRLWWIDIQGKALHAYVPAQDTNFTYPMEQQIGTVVPVEQDKNLLVVALEDGVYSYNLVDDAYTGLCLPGNDVTQMRFNDGKCSPKGDLFVGSMDYKGKKRAKLYKISFAGCDTVLDNISISNGIAWLPDGSKMYYIDTPTRKVQEFAYNKVSGDIKFIRDAFTIADSLGHPDGSTMDSEGKLWIGMWGGAAVTRWDPQTGELLKKIELPAKNVTSCAFGGPDLNILYVTTASAGTKEEEMEKYPGAGKLFRIKTDVKGIPAYLFNMEADKD